VIRVYVELAGEATDLARAEALAAARALGGRGSDDLPVEGAQLVGIDLGSREDAPRLAHRIALARRCLLPMGGEPDAESVLREAGRSGRTGAVRRLGRPTSGDRDEGLLRAGRAFVEGGGSIDLNAPARRFWIAGPGQLFEEVAAVDRSAASTRRMPRLPFQRPVSLPPRLARAAANLAEIRSGDRVLDPFVGTGALLAEAGLLGARVFGIDRSTEMVRGAMQNLGYFGLSAEALVAGDAGDVEVDDPEPFDAILTDPPYGRSSSTGGETGAGLVARVLPRWAERIRPGGRIVLILGEGAEPLGADWRYDAFRVRVHRSLTREFRVYTRSGASSTRA
jgi:putative methyltransferase (TIGR01177 family)